MLENELQCEDPNLVETFGPLGVHAMLVDRGKRYGKFSDNAQVAQDIKYVMSQGKNWDILKYHQKEALEMIAHKIGRILNGDPDYSDSWLDIAGYAQLVVDILNGTEK